MNRKARRAAQSQASSGLRQLPAFPGAAAANPTGEAASQVAKGNLHLRQGRPDDAINCYLRAIELRPDQMDAHNNLCAVLLAQGQFDAVARHFEQIVAVKPDYIEGYNTWAIALLGTGDAARALEAVRRALRIAETPENKSLFVMCLRRVQTVPPSNDMRDLMIRALSEPWGRPSDLVGPCLDLIKNDAVIADGIARTVAAWPARVAADELFGPAGLDPVARHPLLRCLLENARTDNVALERYLTSARLGLLEAATLAAPQDKVDQEILGFYCALARQCFINEYIYARTDQEWAQFEALRNALTASLRRNAPVPVLWPVAVGAYAPLHWLDGAQNLLGRGWPVCVDALLTQQVREPTEERRLRGAIPLLTPIDDTVSMLVQAQYEENPYPRWVKSAPVGGTTTIDARLRSQFPLSRFRERQRTGAIQVLIAGCGTGQQVVDVAQCIAGARVLAVDLSLTSLCYAKRQTDALGLGNVTYAQADILQFAAFGRTFDVIDCGGVLHHLADPEAGWRSLVSQLRPNGVMRVALYSERAREHIAAARAFAASRGYEEGTAEEIRQFRQDVLALPDGDPIRALTRSSDFFSLSECRDLVFHVQEHRFTLPRIKAFLTAHGLEFLGFEVDRVFLSRYSARFPDDRARTDLDRWHAFEHAHPSAFGGMYQFWIQKPA